MNYVCIHCGAKARHMGFGQLGVEHSYSCPRFDGDHLDSFSRKEDLPEWVVSSQVTDKLDLTRSDKDKIDWNPEDKTCPDCGSCLDDGFCECCDEHRGAER